MRFLRLVIENYKSFQFPTEIDFTHGRVEPGRNIFLVGGMNGAGKTAVLEAFNICLYGEKKNRIFQAINRKEAARGNVSCSFELHLETDEGEQVVVKRSWAAPETGNRPRPDDLEEKLSVIKDGKRVSVASQQMWQDYLDVTIPKGITQFFLFDGEKIQEMAADEHAELKLKASMEAALGIELVRRLTNDLTHLRNEERRNRTDITDEDISLKENELQILRRKKEKAEQRREEIKRDIEEFEAELAERKKRFSTLFDFEAEDVEERKIRERRRLQASTRLTDTDHEVRRFAEKTLPLALLGGMFNDLRAQIDAEAEAKRSSAVRDVAEDLADAIVSKSAEPATVCCGKSLSEAERRVLRDRVLDVVRAFNPRPKQKRTNPELLQLSDTESARVLVRLEEVEQEHCEHFARLLKERVEIALQVKDLERELRKTTVSDSDREVFSQLQAEIESYATQLGRKREEARLAEEDLVDLENSISTREKELDVLYQKHSGSKEQEVFLQRCEDLVALLSEYADRLREKKIAELQERTFEMYRKLASKGDLVASVEIDPKTYLITIKDRSGHIVAKQNLSAGEKEVFAISLLWGLAQTSQLQLPVVIDTPLSRLDSTHRDRIVRNYFPSAGNQVIVLSTDTEVDRSYYRQLESHLQHAVQLRFDKHRELTTLEEGYFWDE
jgi:DNA sulfur modification protein DndD